MLSYTYVLSKSLATTIGVRDQTECNLTFQSTLIFDKRVKFFKCYPTLFCSSGTKSSYARSYQSILEGIQEQKRGMGRLLVKVSILDTFPVSAVYEQK